MHLYLPVGKKDRQKIDHSAERGWGFNHASEWNALALSTLFGYWTHIFTRCGNEYVSKMMELYSQSIDDDV